MVPPAPDRYEPMPGLAGLVAWIRRRVGRRGKALLVAAGVSLVAVGAVFAFVLAPEIDRNRKADELKERRDVAARRAALRVRLEREGVPRRGRSVVPADRRDDADERTRLIAGLERAITADATSRAAKVELRGPIRRTVCNPYPRRAGAVAPEADPASLRGTYDCVAVTSEIPPIGTKPGIIGYPFRAAVDFERFSYAWCRVPGSPGEGGAKEPLFTVPRACSAQPGA